MKSARFLLALVALLLCSQTHAAERVFCEGNCSPDTLRVRFEAPGSGAEISGLNVGDEFSITVTVDVESNIQGFSLGVGHDPAKLQALETAVTQTVRDLNPFFDSASLAIGRGDEEIDPTQTELRFGFVAAAIFPILPAPGVTLPKGNGIELATCRYRVLEAIDGDVGTLIEFANDLIPNPGAPQTAVNYTISGVSTPPANVEDGVAKGVVDNGNGCDGQPDWALSFGDDVGTSLDATGQTQIAIHMRNALDSLGYSAGVSFSGDSWSFADDVIGNANDTIQLLITDSDGIDHAPVTNSATGMADAVVVSVERGSAVAGFNPGDFLGVDMNPSIGGPGLTVGYVSDTSGTANVIPATGTTAPCTNEVLVINVMRGDLPSCPMWAFAFGDDPRVANHAITGDTFPITMRNESSALGFSMGVATDNGSYSFVDDVLGNANTTIQLLIPDNDGIEHVAAAANTASGDARPIESVTAGADIANNTGDFLAVDLSPTVGGTGFTAGYVADVGGSGDTIPATAVVADQCPTNEILVVAFVGDGPRPDGPFARGDCNGNGRLNVTDGAICAQNIFFNRIVFFNCDEMLDANDDDTLDMSDPVTILMWVFLDGADLPPPFQTCGLDTADDTLGCATGQTLCAP
jgi:hypothetical protein